MMRWLAGQSLRRAPRRLILGALGVAFPVGMLAATLLFLDRSVTSMTQIALGPIQIEQRALATSLDVNMTKVGHQLTRVPGVTHVDRFAAADVFVNVPGTTAGASARLFAVDPAYLRDHPWVRAVGGSLDRGALLGQTLRGYAHAFAGAKRISISLPGGGGSFSMPAGGTVDLRRALPTWFAIPAGDVQGDVALVPRAIVIPYDTFQNRLLSAIRAKLGPTTPVLDPSLTDLPPVSLEAHISVAHRAYPSDPGSAALWSDALRHLLERTPPPGSVVVSDNAYEPLTEASSDATSAKILFILLGIPGALVAAALGLAAQSALAEAQRREDALLQLRGATQAQVTRLAALNAMAAGVLGSVLGLCVAIAGVSAVEGQPAWQGISPGSVVAAMLAAAGIGAATTCVRLIRLLRISRRSDVMTGRRVLERGWRPLWLRTYLDLVAIGAGLTIIVINVVAGGVKLTPIEAAQATTLALSFYVLLAPIALWVGLTLFAVRLLLTASRRWTRPDRARPLSSWHEAALRWLGRRPARTGVVLVLGVLAVSFGTQVITFAATYEAAKHADAVAGFGSDLRLTPGDPLTGLPKSLGPEVSSTSPIREVPVRTGTDRKTIMAIDIPSYRKTATSAPQIVAGNGLQGLVRDPSGVIVAEEIATDFAVGPGDNLPVTIFPDDPDLSRNINLRVVGVSRSFPPSNPYAEMVMSVAGLPPYSAPIPDFYMARDATGHAPAAVANDLSARSTLHGKFAIQTLAGQVQSAPRSLASLNLGGLRQIEAIGAGLIAAVGVAVLGAFGIFERRREFAVLEVVGADTRQAVTGPAAEGLVALLGSVVIGLPIGFGLGLVSVRVLGLFFTVPPPLLSISWGSLIGFVALMLTASIAAIGGSLVAVRRVTAASVLREP